MSPLSWFCAPCRRWVVAGCLVCGTVAPTVHEVMPHPKVSKDVVTPPKVAHAGRHEHTEDRAPTEGQAGQEIRAQITTNFPTGDALSARPVGPMLTGIDLRSGRPIYYPPDAN
jgi:hypothetical protein